MGRWANAILGAVVGAALVLGLPPAEARDAKAKPAAAGAGLKGADAKAADLARIEKYLNNMRTMSAHFFQSTSDGGEAEGTLYLARPGRLRVEYSPPTPVLIVSDGNQVHYYDFELNQVSTIGLSATPAAVLVREKYNLSNGDIHVTEYERGPGVIRVTLQDSKNPDVGSLALTFQDSPMTLKQWKVTDAQGVVTTVALSEARQDVALSPKLFDFTDPTRPVSPFGNQ